MSSELKKASVSFKFLGGLLLFLVIGLCALIWSRVSSKSENLDDKRAQTRLGKWNELQKDNHVKLNTYAWVSKEKGIVQLRIDRAEDLVVAELKSKSVKASAVKVENPYPYGLQQPVAPAAAPANGAPAAPAPGAAAPAPSAPSTAPVPAPAAAPAAPQPSAPSTAPAP